MKTFSKFLGAVLAVGLMSYGCQPESVEPNDISNNPAADVGEEHPPVDPVCGVVWTGDIRDDNQQPGEAFAPRPGRPPVFFDYGYVETIHSVDRIVVQVTNTAGWYTSSDAIFVGLITDVPRHPDGSFAPEEFPIQNQVNPVRQLWEQSIPITPDMQHCLAVVVWFRVGRLDAAGNLTNIRSVWAAGVYNPIDQGYSYVFCWDRANCPPTVDITPECATVLTGYPGTECTTLTVAQPTTGVPPYTYTWTNNQNGNVQVGQSIQVCPVVTTTYTVTVCGSSPEQNNCASGSATVNVVYVGCTGGTNGNGDGDNSSAGGNNGNGNPNHKVIVCHKPPGNPANVQTICIDWDGVPAHVERFRDPTMNPNMGHDSGCEIGPCDLSDPCL